MAVTYVSRDGHWKVSEIILNGQHVKRVEHDDVLVNGHVVLHTTPGDDGRHRCGPVKMAGGWFLVAEVHSPNQVAQFVTLSDLEEVTKP